MNASGKLGSFVVSIGLLMAGCATIGEGLVEAERDTDVALVWRGFTHEWIGEVHRTGRFGNWIEVDTDQDFPRDVSLHHMARTGTATDDADFSVEYDVVQGTHVRFVAGTHTFPVDETELETLRQTETVTVSVGDDDRLDDKDVFAALINGFSIQVRDGSVAKKLGTLMIELSRPVRVGNEITFDIDTSIMMSCKSTECTVDEGFRNGIHYDLHVHWLLLASTNEWSNIIEHDRVVSDYDYDSRDPVPESLGDLNGTSIGPPLANGYDTFAFGMRRFRFHVEKETDLLHPDPVPHLFAWKMEGMLVGNALSAPELEGQAFFAHSNNGVTNVGHQGHVRITFDPVTVQIKVGLKEQCAWNETALFGNNRGNGVEEQVRSGVLQDKGELACL